MERRAVLDHRDQHRRRFAELAVDFQYLEGILLKAIRREGPRFPARAEIHVAEYARDLADEPFADFRIHGDDGRDLALLVDAEAKLNLAFVEPTAGERDVARPEGLEGVEHLRVGGAEPIADLALAGFGKRIAEDADRSGPRVRRRRMVEWHRRVRR